MKYLLVGLVLSAAFLAGCASPEEVAEAQETAHAANTALDVIGQELDGLRADLTTMMENADDPKAQEAAAKIIGLIDEKSAAAKQWIDALEEANATIQKDQTGWGWAEAGLGVIAGLFPPAAIGVPMLRRARSSFNGVVASMAAGGGPKSPDDARRYMNTIPGLKDKVTAVRIAIGDKELVATKKAA